MATRAIVTCRRALRDGSAEAAARTAPCRASCVEKLKACETAVGRLLPLRTLYFFAGVASLGLTALLFVLGIGVPPALAAALEQDIRGAVIATDNVPQATGLTGGVRVHERYDYSVMEWFNYETALGQGDHPVADIMGPVSYNVQQFVRAALRPLVGGRRRNARRPQHHERQRSGPTMGYKMRTTRQLNTGATETGKAGRSIYMPNPAWHFMQGVFKQNPLVVDWEDGGIPMLAAIALHQVKAQGPMAIKRILWSQVGGAWHADAVNLIYGGNADGFTAHFVASDRDALVTAGYAAGLQMSESTRDYDFLLLPTMNGVTGSTDTQLSMPVARKLLDPLDSFSVLHHSGIAAWLQALRFFDPALPLDSLADHHAAVQAFGEYWLAQTVALDPRYINNDPLILAHLKQIMAWLTQLFDGEAARHWLPGAGDVGRIAVGRVQQRVADLMFHHGVLTAPEWDLVLPAQMGSNAATGLAYWLGDRGVPQESRQLTRQQQVTGPTLENECMFSRETSAGLTSSDHGGSMADNTWAREQQWHEEVFWVPPEASCVLAREQASDPTAYPRNFQSKYNETEMAHLLALFTTGAAMPGVPTPVDSALVVNGSANIAKLYFGVKDIWTDYEDRTLFGAISLDSNRTSSGFTDILRDFTLQQRTMLQNNPDTPQYLAAQVRKQNLASAYTAASGREGDAVGAGAMDNSVACREHLARRWELELRHFDLSCQQLFDLVFWLDYLAREFVLEPQFTRDDPEATLPSVGERRAGPVIKTTAATYLTDGVDDAMFLRVFGFRFPGAAPYDSPDANQWALDFGEGMPLDYVNLGTEVSLEVGRLVRRNGSRSLETWGDRTLVGGSATGWQKPPQLKRIPDYGGYETQLAIWMPALERQAVFRFIDTVQDGSRGLRVQRYALLDASDIETFPSDVPFCRRAAVQSCRGPEVEAGLPACLRSLRFAPSLLSPSRSYGDFAVGQPYLYGCDEVTQELGWHWKDGVTVNRGSHAAFQSWVEYEPLLGQATRSRFREGRFVVQKPSRWYAAAVPAILQLHALSRVRDVPEDKAAAWAADVGTRNTMIDSSIPGACFGLGVVLLLAGIVSVFLFRRQRALDMARVRPPRVRNFAAVQAARHKKLAEAEANLRAQRAGRQAKTKRSARRSAALHKQQGAPPEPEPAAAGQPKAASQVAERAQFTLEEIEAEMARLAERKAQLEAAAKAGRPWATALGTPAARPGTAPADAEMATARAAAPSLAAVSEEDKAHAEVQLDRAATQAAVKSSGALGGWFRKPAVAPAGAAASAAAAGDSKASPTQPGDEAKGGAAP